MAVGSAHTFGSILISWPDGEEAYGVEIVSYAKDVCVFDMCYTGVAQCKMVTVCRVDKEICAKCSAS